MELMQGVSDSFNSLEIDEQAMVLTFVDLSMEIEGFDAISAMMLYKKMKTMLESEMSEWEN